MIVDTFRVKLLEEAVFLGHDHYRPRRHKEMFVNGFPVHRSRLVLLRYPPSEVILRFSGYITPIGLSSTIEVDESIALPEGDLTILPMMMRSVISIDPGAPDVMEPVLTYRYT